MADVLVAPDIEALLVSTLPGLLADRGETAVVATRVPNPRPARLVRVRHQGGPRVALVLAAPTVLIECWSDDEIDAGSLARLVGGLIGSLDGETIDGNHITRAEILGGPSNDPDPESDMPRYSLTCQLHVRMHTI